MGLVVFLLLVMGYQGATSTMPFDLDNPSWEGSSDLQAFLEDAGSDVSVLSDVSGYRDAPSSASALILSPATGYSASEAAAMRSFLDRGGTVVVAEDYGPHSNALLADIGASARFTGFLVRDADRHFQGSAMPVARGTDGGVATRVVLNHGTTISPGSAAPLMNTSELSYEDRDRDGEPDPGEEPGERVVVAVEEVGAGRVVLVGDPSIFINVMLEGPGNDGFVRELLGGRRVLLDRSHAPEPPLLVHALITIRSNPVVGGGVVVLILAGVFAGFRLGRRRRETPVDLPDDGVRALLRKRRPDAGEEEIDRVVGSISRGKIQEDTARREQDGGG